MNKLIIKFIGGGKVVRNFLSTFTEVVRSAEVEIYELQLKDSSHLGGFKVKSINEFVSEEAIVFLCASVCETKILTQIKSNNRIDVALPNLHIVKKLISDGCFNKGLIFVLTNPSDLIAEYILKSTRNRKVFALGPFFDIKRYNDILQLTVNGKSSLTLLGQHYQDPILQLTNTQKNSLLPSNKIYINPALLKRKYQERIIKEFELNKPPYESGAENINNVIFSLKSKLKIPVSGYDKTLNAFVCGYLNPTTMKFISNRPTNRQEYDLLDECLKRHHQNYQRITGNIL